MGDLADKLKDAANDAENKAHEMKGRAKQKNDDMKAEDQE